MAEHVLILEFDLEEDFENDLDDESVSSATADCEGLETRVRVSGVPVNARPGQLDEILAGYGELTKVEKYAPRDGHTQVVHVTYCEAESAEEAVRELNGFNLDGSILRADRLMDRRRSGPRSGPTVGGGSRGMGPGMTSPTQRPNDFPLRILVLSEMVGAIIGRQGATIRQITQQTRARVDVHRKDNAGSLEKAITIYGNPDNCTNACKQILEVMQEEAHNTNKGEIPLRILAHNNLIGRIIGKAGATIKRIMEETNSRITVSSINDINSFNLERIITIKGTIEDIAAAENKISARLRSSYESDLQAFAPQTSMFPGLHPMTMMSTSYGAPRGGGGGGMYGSPQTSSYPPVYPQMGAHQGPGNYHQSDSSPPSGLIQEEAYLFIPNSAVGAIIGTKGSHIRNIIRFSGATVKIAPLEDGVTPNEATERRVTITGSPEAQWKAQYLIFEKIREEGYGVAGEDIRMTVEIIVPSSQVGRIIGKGGQNVRDLQRQTGAVIKLPQQGSNTSDETTVHIMGPFFSIQSAQRRIHSTIQSSMTVGNGRLSRGPQQNARGGQ